MPAGRLVPTASHVISSEGPLVSKLAQGPREGDSIWKNNPGETEALTSDCFSVLGFFVFPPTVALKLKKQQLVSVPPPPARLPHHPSTRIPAVAHTVGC